MLRFLGTPTVMQIAIVVVGATVVLNWYGGPYFRYFMDDYFPFNPSRDAYYFSYSWVALRNTGAEVPYGIMAIPFTYFVWCFQLVGVPLQAVQIWSTAALFALSGLGMFRLARLLSRNSGKTSDLASLAGALLYMFNPIAIAVYYLNGWPISNIFLAGLPWFVYFLILGLRRCSTAQFPYAALGATILLSLPVVGANEPANVSAIFLFLVLGTYELSRLGIRTSRSFQRGVIYLIAASLGSFFMNWFWFFPQYLFASNPGNFFTSSYNQQLVGDFIFGTTSATVFSVIAIGGFPPWGWQAAAFLYTGEPRFVALGAILPLLVFLPLTTRGWQKRVDGFHLYALSLLLGLVALMTGIRSPLPFLASTVLSHPYLLQLMRVPSASLGPAQVVLYAVALQHALCFFAIETRDGSPVSRSAWQSKGNRADHKKTSRAVRTLLIAAVVVSVGLYPFPLWTGSYSPNVPPVGAFVAIPDYAYATAAFIRERTSGYATLLLPLSAGQELSRWPRGYFGQSILAHLIGYRTIYNPSNPLVAELDQAVYTNLTNSRFSNLLAMLNVKFLVVRNDAYGPFGINYPAPRPEQIVQFLERQPDVRQVARFGEYQVFENENLLPLVFASSSFRIPKDSYDFSEFLSNYSSLAGSDRGTGWTSSVPVEYDTISLKASYTSGNVLPPPGSPVIINSVPLGIDTSKYPLLEVNLTTGPNTAVVIMASSRSNLDRNTSFWKGDPIPLVAANGAPFALPQGAWYVVPDFQTLRFNLRNLPYTDSYYPIGTPLDPLNFLAFNLYPIRNGEIVPLSELEGNLSVSIRSLRLATPSFYASSKTSSMSPGGVRPFIPQEEVLLPSQVDALLGALPVVSYVEQDPTRYIVTVRNASGPFLLTLAQSFDEGWMASVNGEPVSTSHHFVGNLYANSWLIGPKERDVTIHFAFSPQLYQDIGSRISIGTGLLALAMCLYPYLSGFLVMVSRRRRAPPFELD